MRFMSWSPALTGTALLTTLLSALGAAFTSGCGSDVDETNAGAGGAGETGGMASTGGMGEGATSAGGSGGEPVVIATGDVPMDFSLTDENATSLTSGEAVSPRDYLEVVSGWYFGHAT